MSTNKKHNLLLIFFIVILIILTIIQLSVSFVKQDFLWVKEVCDTEEGRIGILAIFFFTIFCSAFTCSLIENERI